MLLVSTGSRSVEKSGRTRVDLRGALFLGLPGKPEPQEDAGNRRDREWYLIGHESGHTCVEALFQELGICNRTPPEIGLKPNHEEEKNSNSQPPFARPRP